MSHDASTKQVLTIGDVRGVISKHFYTTGKDYIYEIRQGTIEIDSPEAK